MSHRKEFRMLRVVIFFDYWARIVTTILLSALMLLGILISILGSVINDNSLFNLGIVLISLGAGVMAYRDRPAGRKDRRVIAEKLQRLYDRLRYDSHEQLPYKYNDTIGIDIVLIHVDVVVDNKTPLQTKRIFVGYRPEEGRVYAQRFHREVTLRQWHIERALLHIQLAMKELGL